MLRDKSERSSCTATELENTRKGHSMPWWRNLEFLVYAAASTRYADTARAKEAKPRFHTKVLSSNATSPSTQNATVNGSDQSIPRGHQSKLQSRWVSYSTLSTLLCDAHHFEIGLTSCFSLRLARLSRCLLSHVHHREEGARRHYGIHENSS